MHACQIVAYNKNYKVERILKNEMNNCMQFSGFLEQPQSTDNAQCNSDSRLCCSTALRRALDRVHYVLTELLTADAF